MIRASEISISYGSRLLIEGLDLALESGSMTAIIGSNGSGKSSLMRVLNGIQDPVKGSVQWDGREVKELSIREKAMISASLYSEFARVEGFSVRDLISLGRSHYTGFLGRLSAKDKSRVEEAAQATGIQDLLDQNIISLSDGEFRKAMLAKLLAQDSEILFLDEPTSHLDLPAALEFLTLLKQQGANGKTIVLTTHQLPLAFKMADMVLLLDGMGRFAFGPPSEIMEHELLCHFLKTDKIRIKDGNLLIQI